MATDEFKSKDGINHCEKTGPQDRDGLHDAQEAAEQEREITFLQSLKLYPAAIAWSVLLSTAIVMEGYDTKLIGSLNAQPAFTKRYGTLLPSGKYQIPAPWQAGLSNGATVGSLIGLYLNGHISERIGFKKTMLASLVWMTAAIFIPVFAPSIEVLLAGQVLQGIPWGVFQTLTTAYAAEVCPVNLRGYLTTYVNLCWVSDIIYQLISRAYIQLGSLSISRSSGNFFPPASCEPWQNEPTSGPTESHSHCSGCGPSL